MAHEKNPLLIPKPVAKARTCPKCGSKDWNGRRIGSAIIFTCSKPDCKAEFGGGLPIDPIDPTRPTPPLNPADKPLVDFVKSKHPDAVEGYREVRRRPSRTPDFRTGAYIPPEED